MIDIEIHEHLVMNWEIGRLQNRPPPEDWNSPYRHVEKHSEYSEWVMGLYRKGDDGPWS